MSSEPNTPVPAEELTEPVQSSAESTGDTAKPRTDRNSDTAAPEAIYPANLPRETEDGFNPKSRWQHFRNVLEQEYASWPADYRLILVNNLRAIVSEWESSSPT
jgi:hypothetical protein